MSDTQNASSKVSLRGFHSPSDYHLIANIHNQSALKDPDKAATAINATMVEHLVSATGRLRIAESKGQPVGFIFVLKEGTMQLDEFGTLEGRTWLFTGPTCLPAYDKTAIKPALLNWLIGYAKERSIATLIRFVRDAPSQENIRRLLERELFREEQRYYKMLFEMTEPPPPPGDLPGGLELVDYRGEEDFERLWSVLEAAFAYDSKSKAERYNRSKHIFGSLESPYRPICVEKSSQRPIGTIVTTAKDTHGVIATFGVIPSFQRKGIGSRLMESALHHLWQAGVRTIDLAVRTKNPQALGVYERFGFQAIPKQTTIVLIKDLDNPAS
ncbi:MAG: GNAT family N-acetyltransferase [Candidatus Heimdallarchaeota archaeon]